MTALYFACRFRGVALADLPLVEKAQKQTSDATLAGSKPKPKMTPDGVQYTMTGILRELDREKDSMGGDLKYDEIWEKYCGRLGDVKLNPVKTMAGDKNISVTYDIGLAGERKTQPYTSFKTTLCKLRRKPSS